MKTSNPSIEENSKIIPITKNQNNLLQDDDIDLIMKDISLKKPRRPFTQFVLKEIERIKSENKDVKIEFIKLNQILAEKWKSLKKDEKDKYIKLIEDEKYKYKSNIEIVRHYIFKDYDDNFQQIPTAYNIFINEKLRLGFEKKIDPKLVKEQASSEWNNMSVEEKEIYNQKKKGK